MKREERKVIHWRNLPSRPPLLLTVVGWLVLDKIQAPDWMWGVAWTLFGFIWMAWIVNLFNEKVTDIFPKEGG